MSGRRLLALNASGHVSGAERVLVRVLTAARAAGWEVACAAPAGPLAEELAVIGVRHHPLPELGLSPGRRPAAFARTLGRWGRAARVVRRAAGDADLLLANSLTALPVVRLARPRPPAVWLAHDVVVRADRLRLYRSCRGALNGVVAVSEAVAQRLRGDGPRVEVVHNGVPWPVEPAAVATGPPVVGLNAVLTPWKGHAVLLDAVRMLPDDVQVELIGGHLPKDAGYAEQVRAAAARPETRGRVRLQGHVDDPVARMRRWSVAVSASVEPEACPLNVLEAMSLGVPVVATDHGGAPEVLDGAGLLVPPDDPAALADAVTRLLTDADLHQRCARLGRERVAAAHRLDRQTERLLEVLASHAREPR